MEGERERDGAGPSRIASFRDWSALEGRQIYEGATFLICACGNARRGRAAVPSTP